MPPYRFLFEKRKIERHPSPEALVLPGDLAPPGYEVVPKPAAKALAAYLVSLRADAPLFIAPVTVAAAAPTPTNGPGPSGDVHQCRAGRTLPPNESRTRQSLPMTRKPPSRRRAVWRFPSG